jgi:hypothetical protein
MAGGPNNVYGLLPSSLPVVLSRTRLTKTRILVCAPSNAAVDEIVLRVLRQGLLDGQAQAFVPTIVRAGVAKRTHLSVAKVTLDALVNKALDGREADYQEVCALFWSEQGYDSQFGMAE